MRDKRYQTFVFKGEMDTSVGMFAKEYLNMEPVAWSVGQALDEKSQLEDFIRDLAFGEIDNPVEAAKLIMDKMGWG